MGVRRRDDNWVRFLRGDRLLEVALASVTEDSKRARHLTPEFLTWLLAEHQEVEKIDACPLKIVFAGFPLYLDQFEGAGLPLYTRKALPNAKIWTFSSKRGINFFGVGSDGIWFAEPPKSVDLIVARGNALIELARTGFRELLDSASMRINIKTMCLPKWERFADSVWPEIDMSPPSPPWFAREAAKSRRVYGQTEALLVPGTIRPIKNQLTLVNWLPREFEWPLVFLGDAREKRYWKNIQRELSKKKIDWTHFPHVPAQLMPNFLAKFSYSAIPMHCAPFGQSEGYPRSLGESLAAGLPAVTHPNVTVPPDMKPYVTTTDFSDQDVSPKVVLDTLEKLKHRTESYDPSYWQFCETVVRKLMDELSRGGARI